jgi:hypothetical protein
MNYQDTRDSEQLRILDKSIDTFISGFHPTAQTIIFFPGGLASRLLRAKTPYKPNSRHRNVLTSTVRKSGSARGLLVTLSSTLSS